MRLGGTCRNEEKGVHGEERTGRIKRKERDYNLSVFSPQ